jgi:hypothetical protein
LIITKQSGEAIDVAAIARSPMIYLDNWALSGVFANDRVRQQRLLNTLNKRGTLFLSWANVMELPAYSPIRTLFDGIGENWYPLEWSPFSCMRKEEQISPGDNSPALSASLLETYYPFVHQRVCSLSELLDLSRKYGARVQAARNKIKEAVQRLINLVKSVGAKDPSWIENEFPPISFNPQQPTRYVFTHLMRALAAERGFTFTANDGMDLVHTVVPVAYADFVLLDKSWTQRVRCLSMPGRAVYAFYEAEVDQFLDALESLEIRQTRSHEPAHK